MSVNSYDPGVERCTALAIGKDATASGSVMISHGNDCPTCDFRVAYVPSMSHPPNTFLPIWPDFDDYPRFITSSSLSPTSLKPTSVSFAEIYSTTIGTPSTQLKPLGYIPQIPSTFSYIDGAYGIQNEKQLSFGESTCDAILGMRSKPRGFEDGKALFGIAALSRIALQRCDNARCAVELMGGLAVEEGFYGGNINSWINGDMEPEKMGYAEGGEALTIADKHEVWIFEICPDDTGEGAVWVAQRVPDSEVCVVTNTFQIGKIDLKDEEFFMASQNVYDVAVREKLWDPEGDVAFDFAQIYRAPMGHQLPNTSKTSKRVGATMRDRRRWVVYNTVAPSLKFDGFREDTWDDSDTYLPFSVKPDHKLTQEEVFRIHRDFYQGTPFDITKSAVGGPFGDPYRGTALPDESPFNDSEEWNGTFERSVAQLWTSYTTITESRAWLPDWVGARVWYGPHSAVTNAFVPIYPGAAKSSNRFPKAFEVGSLLSFDEESYWWNVCLVSNYAARFFSFTLEMIQDAQEKVEGHLLRMTSEAEQRALELGETEEGFKFLENMQQDVADYAMSEWKVFFKRMVSSFHDGILFKRGDDGSCAIEKKMAYPAWWLNFLGPKNAGLSKYNTAEKEMGVSMDEAAGDGAHMFIFSVAAVSMIVGLVAGRMLPAITRGNSYEAIPQ
ncbi:hypothetical protein TrST_g12258 [Triparma strigata]|uniref:Dipeptidase n=1 Tax=Triparma strigata TaxID=1606541 RepID=A0A9W7B9Q0_9STRA|nr:hypothetical protein TrST_g12258 [Triparma strigata]